VSRIAATLAACRQRGQAALVPYLTAGDPDLEATRAILRGFAASGADRIELGVPFSDPMADGPVLQRSAARALASGTTLMRVLEMIAEMRAELATPIVLFGYYNPLFRYGVERIAKDAAAAGVDGFLCVDLPPEEAGDLRAAATAAGLDLIAMLAPTTPLARVKRIAASATGFLYFVSVLGVTGARTDLPKELPALVEAVRSVTSVPIGVGFGVQSPEQAAWVAGFADAVVVGSAIARILEDTPRDAIESRVAEFVGGLAAAMRAAGR
jgi:tryptophan synthase alpha chain